MSLLVKRADWVITLNDRGERVREADVLVRGPAIAAIGPGVGEAAVAAGEPIDETIDGRGKAVIPGLVNTHHHLYQTLTRNIPATQDLPLFPWLVKLYEVWRELDEEAVEVGALVGLGELLKTGCTTSTDHHYVFPKGAGGLIDAQIRAAKRLGIRFHPTRGSMSLGRSQGGLPPDDVVQSEEEILADSRRLAETYHDPAPYSMCRLALAPCSPFSVTPELMRRTVELARALGLRVHTHLAETKDEERFCLDKFGCRPLAYMERLGWTGEDVWFAHAIHLNDDEVLRLGETRTGVAHCPASNMKLNSGVCRVPDLLKAGARVGLAVDGSASNDSSDMWGEMRQAYLLSRLAYGDRGLRAEDVLRLATVGGAQVLGRDDLGHLAAGMAADLALIDLDQLGFAGGRHDPVAAIVASGDSHIVDTTIVNGRVVVRGGRLVGADEGEIVRRANRISAGMLERAGRRTGTDYMQSST
ncbi:MAG: 8-oxoguanine deaminase [Bacillota bacterium]